MFVEILQDRLEEPAGATVVLALESLAPSSTLQNNLYSILPVFRGLLNSEG